MGNTYALTSIELVVIVVVVSFKELKLYEEYAYLKLSDPNGIRQLEGNT